MYFVLIDSECLYLHFAHHLLFNGEDKDNDSNILKCLLNALLFYMPCII